MQFTLRLCTHRPQIAFVGFGFFSNILCLKVLYRTVFVTTVYTRISFGRVSAELFSCVYRYFVSPIKYKIIYVRFTVVILSDFEGTVRFTTRTIIIREFSGVAAKVWRAVPICMYTSGAQIAMERIISMFQNCNFHFYDIIILLIISTVY